LHHNGQYGLAGGGDGIVVESNEIANNNIEGYDRGCDAGGTKFIHGKNLVVRGNYIHHNDGPGLWTDGDNINVLFEGNRIEYNSNGGIAHEIGYDAIIRNNRISYNNRLMIGTGKSLWWGGEIALNDSQNVEIYGNVIRADVHGIAMIDTDRGSGAYGVRQVANVYVHDNDITMPSAGMTGLVGDRASAWTSAGNRFVNNTYRLPTSDGRYWSWGSSKYRSEWQSVGNDSSGLFYTWAP
jgi:hypothetical protein